MSCPCRRSLRSASRRRRSRFEQRRNLHVLPSLRAVPPRREENRARDPLETLVRADRSHGGKPDRNSRLLDSGAQSRFASAGAANAPFLPRRFEWRRSFDRIDLLSTKRNELCGKKAKRFAQAAPVEIEQMRASCWRAVLGSSGGETFDHRLAVLVGCDEERLRRPHAIHHQVLDPHPSRSFAFRVVRRYRTSRSSRRLSIRALSSNRPIVSCTCSGCGAVSWDFCLTTSAKSLRRLAHSAQLRIAGMARRQRRRGRGSPEATARMVRRPERACRNSCCKTVFREPMRLRSARCPRAVHHL